MASRKLSESDVYRLCEKWLKTNTEGKKALLVRYGITKATLYNSMGYYGIEFKKILN